MPDGKETCALLNKQISIHDTSKSVFFIGTVLKFLGCWFFHRWINGVSIGFFSRFLRQDKKDKVVLSTPKVVKRIVKSY